MIKPDADNYARAIIASAREYGDCPVKALTSRASQHRRCLAAAALAIFNAVDRTLPEVCRPLNIRADSVTRAYRTGSITITRAGRAALNALVCRS